MTSGNKWDSKPGVGKDSRLGKALRALHCYWREGRQMTYRHTAWKQLSEKHLENTVGRLFVNFRVHPKESAFTERPLQEQTLNSAVSLPHTSAGNQLSTDTT